MAIKYSFESPIELLERSKHYNDYEYALVHLFDQHPQYLAFYEEQIKKRPMYLDNSAYELGESFNPDEFAKWVEHFSNINAENLYYFLPDYPGDGIKTLEAAKEFKAKNRNLGTAKSIGVVHGKDFDEMLHSAIQISKYCDMLALPMLRNGFHHGEFVGMLQRTKARQILVERLNNAMRNKVLDWKPIHLLGCLLPQEFKDYEDGMVYSADTSNPILHGIEGVLYAEDGLQSKSDMKMESVMGLAINPQMQYNIFHNIKAFYRINGVFPLMTN